VVPLAQARAAAKAAKSESDGKKIEYIFNEYRSLMLGKAMGILKDRKLAENALYDAFIQIWKNIGDVDDVRSSRSVVFAVTIVRNCAYALQERKTGELKPDKENKDYTARGLEHKLYEMPASDIVKAVNKLGGENRNIFLLKYAFNFTNVKIARTLNEPEINVAARLQRAQKKMRALLLRGWD